MNMTAMNPIAAGGPVGGMMMGSNSPALAQNPGVGAPDVKVMLNTYIYEYFLKLGHFEVARSLVKNPNFDIKTIPRNSPGRRKDGEVNGIDGETMDMDGKDDIPDDLPLPEKTASSGQEGNGFLFEWFSIFSDLFAAHRKVPAGANMTPASQYLMNHQHLQRMRETQQNQVLQRPGMMQAQFMRNPQMRNGMMNGEIKNRLTPQQMQMIQAQQQAQQKQMQQQQMPRGDQVDGDPNIRPATPADGDNVGSPSKRPKIDGQPFNPAMMQNGARPGMPGVGQQQAMMIQNGFTPGMNQNQFRPNGAMPPKAMPAGMANGMMNMGNSGSPMMAQMSQFPEGMPMDLYNNRMAGQPMQGGPNGQSGNHALQDYQMQLMLLEQQNKKRLMMARQEQHENTGAREGQQMPAGVGIQPGMSPSGSRSGASPNPGDQMKRTPQIGLPGSPSAGDMQGRSPATMNFMNGMQPQDYNTAAMLQGMMGPGGQNMRPPTSAIDMGGMNRQQQQQGRMVGGFPGGQPMQQQPSQGQPMQVGTPGQREMPPPPPATNSAQRNNQAASPANSNAPPTPSQTNKAAPKKNNKTKEEPNRKRPNKKNSTANAPNSEDNAPATSAPSTPLTPVHPQSSNNSGGKGTASGVPQSNQQPQQNAAAPPNQQQMPQADVNTNNSFPDFTAPEPTFNLDFSTLENTDVLENFDFDSFLNTSTDEGFPLDGANFDFQHMDGGE